jgi:argonaute-like protein implicated in RNA metabolism and viral defense
MDQNTCNVCNKSFNSEQELREHQRTAHSAGKKEQGGQTGEQNQPNRDQPNRSEQNQPDRERKIAS